MKRSLFVWCWFTVTARCDLNIKQNMIYMKTAPALKGTASDTGEGSLKTHTCPLTHAISICPAWMMSSQLTDIQWRGDTRVKWLHSKVTPNKMFCNTERCVERQPVPAGGFWSLDQRTLQVPERGPLTPEDAGCCGGPSLCFSAALLPATGGASSWRDASPWAAGSAEVWTVLLFCLDLLKDSRLKSDSWLVDSD